MPAARPARSRIRFALLGGIGLLYIVSIPWYREPGAATGTWLGFPDWVAVSIGCYIAIAILNAIAWLLTEVPDTPPADAGDGAQPSGEPAPGTGGSGP